MVLVRVVPAVVDEVTQVVLGDAVAIHARVLLRRARPARKKGWRAVQEADVVHHQVAHVADPSLGPEHHLREGTISTVSSNTNKRTTDNRTSSDGDVRKRMFLAKESKGPSAAAAIHAPTKVNQSVTETRAPVR